MKIISTLHDPSGTYLKVINKYQNKLLFSKYKIITAVSSNTEIRVCKYLKDNNINMVNGGRFGVGRLTALKNAINTSNNNEIFMYCDFDKILHWIIFHPKEFDLLINYKFKANYLALGRDEETLKSYPESWQYTEKISNKLLSNKLGVYGDYYTSTSIFDNKAAKYIAEQSIEEDFGSCAEWPLLIKRNGLTIMTETRKGLSWEDPDRIDNLSIYSSQIEWIKRTNIIIDQINVIEKF